MELDEFKHHWQEEQKKEVQLHPHTKETLNELIMKTSETLNELQKRNLYWKKISDTVCSVLLGVIAINLLLHFLLPASIKLNSLPEIALVTLYALVTIQVFNYQNKIFDFDAAANLKDNLTEAIFKFKRFYAVSTILYLFLFPAVYFVSLKSMLFMLGPNNSTIAIITTILTILSMAGNHFYYRKKYFSKISAMEMNLKDLSAGTQA